MFATDSVKEEKGVARRTASRGEGRRVSRPSDWGITDKRVGPLQSFHCAYDLDV